MSVLPPPFAVPYIDPKTGKVNDQWRAYLLSLSNAVAADFAPIDARYVVTTANAELTNDINLGALVTGYLKGTVAAGISTVSSVPTIPGSDVSGSALSKVDDTNVTLTLSGAAATALLAAATLTLGWTGLLAVARGGTGANNTTQTYTPTLTNVTNLAASTAFQCHYARVGSEVTVSGRVSVDPTAAAAAELGISLPIASNFGALEDCGGVAFATGIAGQGAGIVADITNDRASMRWVAVDVSNQPMSFVFSYRVI